MAFEWLRRQNIDHYIIRYREDGSGNWQTPPIDADEFRDPDDLDEIIPKEDAINAAEIQNWPPGHYQLIGKKANAGFTDSVWTFQVKPDDSDEPSDDEDEELDPIEQLAQTQRLILEQLDDRGGPISDPSEARGAVFARALDGDLDGANLDRLDSFLSKWEEATSSPPSSPDEVAGQLYQMQMAQGNVEAASALLSEWFAADSGRDDGSLLQMVREGGGDMDVSMDTVKTLGLLKFIDDPRTITREALGGALEGAAPGGVGASAGGAETRAGLADLMELEGGRQRDGEAAAAGVDQEDVDAASETGGEPAAATTGADLDLAVDVADEAGDAPVDEPEPPADESAGTAAGAEDEGIVATVDRDEYAGPPRDAGGSDESGPVTHSEVEAGPDVAEAIEDGGGDEATSEGGDESIGDVVDDLEEQTDREAGDYPDAAESMERLTDAADEGTEGTEGGDA